MSRKRDPVKLGTALARVIAELGHGPAAATLRVAECWEEAVGAEVAAQAEPVLLQGGVLELRASSSVWSQQLQLRSDEILAALRDVLGDEAPRALRFRL